MWIFCNDSYVSIVAHTGKPGMLLVRARKAGDIEALFPGAKPKRTPDHDYAFRVELPAHQAGRVLGDRIAAINYPNFKDSVKDSARGAAYMRVWTVMQRWGRLSGGVSP